MPVPTTSVASVPYLFAPSDFQYNDALNADLKAISSSIVNLQNATWLSITQFGAVGDGVTDNTAAIQSTVNAAQLSNGVVYIPAGFFIISAQININAGITVRGAGASRSFVLMNNSTQNGFEVLTTAACQFYEFQLLSSAPSPSGNGIVFTPTPGENGGSRIENMIFNTLFNALSFVAASTWTVAFNSFENINNIAIFVQNTNNADSGDSEIIGNLMVNGTAGSSVGIEQVSSGGLRIIGNKINVFSYGYVLLPTPGTNSGITVISGNSIENITNSCILISSATPTAGQWRAIEITGNELNVPNGGSAINIGGSTVNTWLLGVTITGNTILIQQSGTTGFGIIADFVTGITIIGNYIEAVAGGGTTTGIDLTANTNGSTIIGNITRDCGTSISNSSTNTAAANNIAL